MEITYANEEAPEYIEKSVFLVGPTPRDHDTPSWRPNMIAALERAGYDGVVFTPEPRGGDWKHDYDTQVEWEKTHLTMADIIIAWVPRELKKMPAFTTNVEFGTWIDSGKIVYGRPPGSAKNRYLDWMYADRGYGEPHTTMDTLAKVVVDSLPDRDKQTECVRTGCERKIPLCVWKLKSFKDWHAEQAGEGNCIQDITLLWQKNGTYAFWLKMWICLCTWDEGERNVEVGLFVNENGVVKFPVLDMKSPLG